MTDTTEAFRREAVAETNAAVQSDDPTSERTRLSSIYGAENVLDTRELSDKFSVQGFMAPFVVVTRKSDNVRGSLQFQHSPRFYFGFVEGS